MQIGRLEITSPSAIRCIPVNILNFEPTSPLSPSFNMNQNQHRVPATSADRASTMTTAITGGTSISHPALSITGDTSTFSLAKRRRTKTDGSAASAAAEGDFHDRELQQPLLPGLPDHLAQLCLAHLPPSVLFAVCRPWRRLLYSPSFPPFLSLYALLSSPSDDLSDSPSIEFQFYDPISALWRPLPPLHPLPFLLRHPKFLYRDLPVQSVAASGQLVVLAATATRRLLPALPRPLVFDTSTSRWRLGPPVPSPRRWCAAGSAGGAVYVASGIGPEYNADVARSAERWDSARRVPEEEERWESLRPLRDGRFSREAIDAVAARGKLYMVSCQGGKWGRDGTVYDIATDRWEEMPAGMLLGWIGPAAAGEDGTIYTVEDEESAGVVWAYDWGRDRWKAVAASEKLKGALQVAAGCGKICAVVGGGAAVAVVDVGAGRTRGKVWVVDPPACRQIIAVHVLPRLSSGGS